MVREATEADVAEIVRLGSQSLLDGPYKGIIKDTPEQSAALAIGVIQGNGKILLYENEAGRVCGLLGFSIFPHYFTQQLTAYELMWYVEPAERKGGGALKLLWQAEKEAKDMGAVQMGFTAPNTDVEDIYKRFGYRRMEVSYIKEL